MTTDSVIQTQQGSCTHELMGITKVCKSPVQALARQVSAGRGRYAVPLLTEKLLAASRESYLSIMVWPLVKSGMF